MVETKITTYQTQITPKSELGYPEIADVALRVNVLDEDGDAIKMDVSNVTSEIEFELEYERWKKETAFLSVNNFRNIHFDAIVSRGEESVPFIYRELRKEPSILYHALELIYPEKIKYKGYISLSQARRIWLRILRKQGLV